MSEAEEAKESWRLSAQAWVECIDAGDINRTHLLDGDMLELAGEVTGLRVLDVGCGEGRFARILGGKGARVVGLEPTAYLVETARTRDDSGSYVRASAERMPLASDAFDLVVSYVVLIDIADFQSAIAEMARVLRPGGRLLIANLNSFCTSRLGWFRDELGNKLHFPVDDYFEERPDRAEWAGMSILNWHRPFQAYMQALLSMGLILREFREPKPSEEAVRQRPKLADSLRVPFFHTMVWQKPEK